MATLKDFEVLSTLGTGAFSSVYKVKRFSDGKEYALKKVKIPSLKYKEKINALNEVRILASINEKNIISYKEAFYDDPSQSLCIIMEYASGGDLLRKIQDSKKRGQFIPESSIWSYLIQLLQGLRTLHSMKILHRDLKSANVFLDGDGKTCKLGDLNVSKIAENGLAHTQAGTPYYASPEVWENKPYGIKSDIWSLGCVIYELCTQLPPFRSPNMHLLFQKVTKGNYEKIPSVYSAELGKVIGMCLQVNPLNRPDCEKLLSHPLVTAKMTDIEFQTVKKIPIYHDLLDTIKMPRNIKNLTDVLPKPKYRQETVSLMNLDAPIKIDEDLRRSNKENRPRTGVNRMNSDKETSLERILNTKDARPEPLRKVTSVPPTDILKKAGKLTVIQKAAKGVLNSDIIKVKNNEQKGTIFKENEGVLRKITTGAARKVVDPTKNLYIPISRINNKSSVRAGSLKAIGDYSLDSKESQRISKKEQNIFSSNINPPRSLKPIY